MKSKGEKSTKVHTPGALLQKRHLYLVAIACAGACSFHTWNLYDD